MIPVPQRCLQLFDEVPGALGGLVHHDVVQLQHRKYRCDFASDSLRLSFDLTSFSHGKKGGRLVTQWKKENSARQRENGKTVPGVELEIHLAARPRARTNETKRFPSRGRRPTSDECIYIYIYEL